MVGGVIVSIGVAVACSLMLNPFYRSHYQYAAASSADGEMWFVKRRVRHGVEWVVSLRSFGPSASPDRTTPPPSALVPYWFEQQAISAQESDNRLLVGYGWPLKSLGYECSVPDGSSSSATDCSCIETDLTPWQDKFGMDHLARRIPCRPLWWGFLIDTLLWMSVFWLLFSGVPALYRYRRLRRGCCPMCGYDLRGSDHVVCPECESSSR